MDSVLLSSPSLNGQEVFIRFTPSGQTEFIDLGYHLLPYTFYYDQVIPPLPNEAGTFFIYCSGIQCTYEIIIGDLIPCTPPTLGTSIFGGLGYQVSPNVFANYTSSTISISGSNITSGQSTGNVYSWYSGSTDITPTGNTQIISFDLSGYSYPILVDFKGTNSIGCPNSLPVVITYIIDPYIEILSTTPDTGSSDGTVTFVILGGYPAPPYGSSENYFVFDCSFTNFTQLQSNVAHTFSGYSSGSCDITASAYNYGGNPTTGFTIGYDPCYYPSSIPTANMFVSNQFPCEGELVTFYIETDGDSWELYSPAGLYNSGVGPCSYCYEYATMSSGDTGDWVLNTYKGSCSATTSININVQGNSVLYYRLVKTSVLGNNNGMVELNSSNTIAYYDDSFNYSPCCPGFFTNIPDYYASNYYAYNVCFGFVPLFVYSDFGCISIPSVDLSANTVTVCVGGTLELSAFGGVTYEFFNILNGPSTYSTTISGDPITGATVTVTTNAQIGVHDGTYACQVTDSTGCMNYQTINISVITC